MGVKTNKLKTGENIFSRASKYGLYVAFVLIFIVLAIANPNFISKMNLINILKQGSITAVVATGATFVLILGGLDLSIGSVVAFAGVCSAFFGMPDEYPLIVPILVSISAGAACGLLNGIIIAKGKVPAFIATLGTMTALRGMALMVTDAKPIFGLSKGYIFLGSGKVFGIPMLIIAMLVVMVIAYIILDKTRFGRRIYAIGGNETAAYVSGVNVVKIKVFVYILAGALSGFTGMLFAGRIQSGTPVMAQGLELDAIAAAVIGGVSTTGGIGRAYGAVVGALLLTMVNNGLDLLGVSTYLQQVVMGTIIILSVYFDVRGKKGKN
jgi:inositol transport system permease protein